MKEKWCWIYIIRDNEHRCFKVGKTNNIPRRLKQLQKQPTLLCKPHDFEVVVAWWLPESEEKEIHRMMGNYHIRGEWFGFSNYEIGELRAWYADYEKYDGGTDSDRPWSPTYKSVLTPQQEAIIHRYITKVPSNRQEWLNRE